MQHIYFSVCAMTWRIYINTASSKRKTKVWKHNTLKQTGSVLTLLHEVHNSGATSLKCLRECETEWSNVLSRSSYSPVCPRWSRFSSAGEISLLRRCVADPLLWNGGYFTGTLAWEARRRALSSLPLLNAWEALQAIRWRWQTVKNRTDTRSWLFKIVAVFTFSLVSESEWRWIAVTFSVQSIELNEPGLR